MASSEAQIQPVPARRGALATVAGQEVTRFEIHGHRQLVVLYTDMEQFASGVLEEVRKRLQDSLGPDVLCLILPKDARLEVVDLDAEHQPRTGTVNSRKGTWDL